MKYKVLKGCFVFCLFTFFLISICEAKPFTFGIFGLNDYDYCFAVTDVVNTTLTELGIAADFYDMEIRYSLAEDASGASATNYVITLSDPNEENIKDSLTWLWFDTYDSSTNTYSDGEDISALHDGESLADYIDWENYSYTNLLIDQTLYIQNLTFSAKVDLNNFTYEDNGQTYVFTGTIDLYASLFSDNWYSIENNLGTSIPLQADIQGQPIQPIPEPSTILLSLSGLLALTGGSFIRKKLIK